jgi:hypothetical protein
MGLFTALAAPSAFANGAYLEITGYPIYRQDNNSSGLGGGFDGADVASSSAFSYDLRNTLGYTFGDRWLVGFSYNFSNSPSKYAATPSSLSLEQTYKSNQWGVSLGYVPPGTSGFRLIGTYFFAGKKSYSRFEADSAGAVSTDYELENKLGSGWQVTLGYSFALGSVVSIGPTLVYRVLSFKSQTQVNRQDPLANYTDREFSTKAIDNGLLPMISIIIRIGGTGPQPGRY